MMAGDKVIPFLLIVGDCGEFGDIGKFQGAQSDLVGGMKGKIEVDLIFGHPRMVLVARVNQLTQSFPDFSLMGLFDGEVQSHDHLFLEEHMVANSGVLRKCPFESRKKPFHMLEIGGVDPLIVSIKPSMPFV